MHVHGRAPVVNAVSIDVLRLVVAEIVDRARLEAIGRADEIVSATQVTKVTKAELSCETREDGRCKSGIAHRVSLNAGAIALGAAKLGPLRGLSERRARLVVVLQHHERLSHGLGSFLLVLRFYSLIKPMGSELVNLWGCCL